MYCRILKFLQLVTKLDDLSIYFSVFRFRRTVLLIVMSQLQLHGITQKLMFEILVKMHLDTLTLQLRKAYTETFILLCS